MCLKWRCPLTAAQKSDPLGTCPFFNNGCSGFPYGIASTPSFFGCFV